MAHVTLDIITSLKLCYNGCKKLTDFDMISLIYLSCSFLSKCTLGPKSLDRGSLSKSNCKLNFKQIYRLGHRMVVKYNLDLCKSLCMCF